MKKFLWTALVGLFVSCSGILEDNRIILDNPTDQEISFKIDNKDYKLPPQGSEKIKLEEGKHQLNVNGQNIEFKTTKHHGGSVINPSNSKYVIFTEYYTDKELNPMLTLKWKEVEINGKEYFGAIKLVDGYFLDKVTTHWDKNLDEKFDNMLYQQDNGQTSFQIGINKIFRIPDFEKYYKEEFEETAK